MVFADLHSHILWDVDDGPKKMEKSIQMLKKASLDGIRHMVATPHYITGYYTYNNDEILRKIKILNDTAVREGIDIIIYSGNEVHADALSLKELSKGNVFTINNSRYVLIEISEDFTRECTRNIIEQILKHGYVPIIAHAERSICGRDKTRFIKKIVKSGAIIQIDAMSITGDMGFAMKLYTRSLLKKRLVHLISTDCHSLNKRPPLLSKAAEITKKYITKEEVKILFYTNVIKIINNEKL